MGRVLQEGASLHFWTAAEISILVDHSHYQELLADEQHFL
jgi:ribonucleotide reductase beta subunit family protein with ferritin-like domain